MKPSFQRTVSPLLAGFFLAGLLAVLVFYMIHNAHWFIGDEAIVIGTTGMGKAFSPLGFEGMATYYGRLYPFAYNLYNVLLPFFPGYVPVWAVYVLQAIALILFSVYFVRTALYLLRDRASGWKHGTAAFFAAVCIFRVYQEFVTCYTGVWIVYLFLPIFLFHACRFQETEKWADGAVALVSINYIIYCYETVFVVPLALGACSLLFSFRNLTPRKKQFNGLLVGSGLLFLCIYAVFVLPKATGFYHHYGSESFFKNAVRMFVAHKIYWLAVVALAIRVVGLVRRKTSYSFYDSLLLSSLAYFVGAAVLKLDFTYYYNLGELVALTALLYFLNQWLKPSWVCLFMVLLMLFYGRKIPGSIERNQSGRTETCLAMDGLVRQWESGTPFYWYAPEYQGSSPSYLDMRGTQRVRMEVYLSWLMHRDVAIPERVAPDGREKGVWLVYTEPGEDIPETPALLTGCRKVFSLAGIDGYLVE